MLSKNYKRVVDKTFIIKGKLLSHRQKVYASEQYYVLHGRKQNQQYSFSDDIRATIEGMKTLGADIRK